MGNAGRDGNVGVLGEECDVQAHFDRHMSLRVLRRVHSMTAVTVKELTDRPAHHGMDLHVSDHVSHPSPGKRLLQRRFRALEERPREVEGPNVMGQLGDQTVHAGYEPHVRGQGPV
jgi:hypothetical protein